MLDSSLRSEVDFTLVLPRQVVKLKDVFPHGTGFVLVFDFMLSDLSEVIRNSERPLTPAQVKGYMMMLLKGVAFLHHNNIMHRVKSFCNRLSESTAAPELHKSVILDKDNLSQYKRHFLMFNLLWQKICLVLCKKQQQTN